MPSKDVRLHIYDVSTNPEMERLNKMLTAVGTGAFHGGIEVYGKEYSYGYVKEGTGIFSNAPKGCAMHHYRESVELGETQLSEADVTKLIKEMEPDWEGKDYDLLRRNCVFFSTALAERLGVKALPKWVTNLAGAGASVQDGAMQAATKAQAAAIIAAAKANEINAKYDISAQAAAKVTDMISAAKGLDEKYHIKDKAADAAHKGGEMVVRGGEMAAQGAQTAAAKARELDEKYQIKEKAGQAAVKGGEMAVNAGKTAIFKVHELAEKHDVKGKINAKMQANGCGPSCGDQCVVQ